MLYSLDRQSPRL
ncbi:hypothetical protein ACJIZ3_022784 [Penstemon smallii]|uniref:Uncharacterized protein n=1 Tax=Penstemon smallii TaxID=265156 RepID=A0ABD3TP35_9LAMI